MRRTMLGVTALVAAALPIAGGAQAAPPQPTTFVFSGEGDRLNAYDAATGDKQTVIWSADDPPTSDGREHKNLNAQICFHSFGGDTYFIAGEDTGQNEDPASPDYGNPGWGWFRLDGHGTGDVHKLTTRQAGKLVPEYTQADGQENYGCGFLDDGRLVLGDVGDQLPHEPATGQLHLWFPDPAEGFGRGFVYSDGNIPPSAQSQVPYCRIATDVGTAGGIWVDGGEDPASAADDVVFLASSRPDTQNLGTEYGILRFEGLGTVAPSASGDPDACDLTGVTRSVFIQGGAPQLTPSAIVGSGHGTYYVSSVFDGSIAEYDEGGGFLGFVAGGTPTGQVNGFLPPPLTVGTPYGLGVAPDGTVWYADIGVVLSGPVRPGRLMKVTPTGTPLPGTPAVVDEGLAFPDGIGILTVHDRLIISPQATQAE